MHGDMREEQFATIALLKTIANAMGEHHAYKELSSIILKDLQQLLRMSFVIWH